MVKNQEQAIQVKELLETLLEAVCEIQNFLVNDQLKDFHELSFEIKEILTQLKSVAESQRDDEVYAELEKSLTNSIVSLERIIKYAKYNKEKAMQKIEFELWPLLRCTHVRFYFSALIYPDKEKMQQWYRTEGNDLCKNYYLEDAKKTGKYKYDISIIIVGYNKVEYTKLCVENVLKNIPQNLKCELILFNHGSSDGTKEYFESICPTKQIDLEVNGAGTKCIYFVSEGKYVLSISNDVIVTPNSIEIMYEALENDKQIAYAVPMTSNVSNLQAPLFLENGGINTCIDRYGNFEELDKITRKHNIYNKDREEMRFRLCDPLSITRNDCYSIQEDVSLYALLLSQGYQLMFPDDFISMHFRRLGYKNVLLKDIYCHHFGSVTIGDLKLKTKDYGDGRKKFLETNGIDPWGKGYCWTYELFNKLLCNKADSERILGINCGMGSDILKIQQEIKQNTGNGDVKIINFTDRQRYVSELKGISEDVYKHKGWNDIIDRLEGKYDYILVGDRIEESMPYQDNISELYKHVSVGGKIIIFVPETRSNIKKWIKDTYEGVTETESCDIVYEIDDTLTSDMPQKGNYLIWSKI